MNGQSVRGSIRVPRPPVAKDAPRSCTRCGLVAVLRRADLCWSCRYYLTKEKEDRWLT